MSKFIQVAVGVAEDGETIVALDESGDVWVYVEQEKRKGWERLPPKRLLKQAADAAEGDN